jgi:hypothetical protein
MLAYLGRRQAQIAGIGVRDVGSPKEIEREAGNTISECEHRK